MLLTGLALPRTTEELKAFRQSPYTCEGKREWEEVITLRPTLRNVGRSPSNDQGSNNY